MTRINRRTAIQFASCTALLAAGTSNGLACCDGSTSDEVELDDQDAVFEYMEDALSGLQANDAIPDKVRAIIDHFNISMALTGRDELSELEIEAIASPDASTKVKTVKLGTHKLPNQHRVHKHSATDWRTETRMHKKAIYATFSHEKLNEIAKHISECCKVAATTAVITAVATESAAAGLAIFYPAWKACMLAHLPSSLEEIARKTKVKLHSEDKYTCWTYHCPD